MLWGVYPIRATSNKRRTGVLRRFAGARRKASRFRLRQGSRGRRPGCPGASLFRKASENGWPELATVSRREPRQRRVGRVQRWSAAAGVANSKPAATAPLPLRRPAGSHEVAIDERLPPWKPRAILCWTAASQPELHWQCDALLVEAADAPLPTLPKQSNEMKPCAGGLAGCVADAHAFSLSISHTAGQDTGKAPRNAAREKLCVWRERSINHLSHTRSEVAG